MFKVLSDVKALFEYLGGVAEELPPSGPARLQGPIWWGIWWAILVLLTLSFSGQTSKFIYIDF